MKAPTSFKRVVNGIRYDVSKSKLIADDVYWDGHNMERSGRNTFLYMTPKGRYFYVRMTFWQGETDRLEPVTTEEARSMYEGPLTEHHVEYEEAFPSTSVEEA